MESLDPLLKRRFVVSDDPHEVFRHTAIVPNCAWCGFQTANVVIGSPLAEDVESLFQPEEDEVILWVPEEFRWAHLLKHLGIFKSAGQARKNGWDKDIPEGWSEAVFKKQRKAIFVFKATRHAE